MVDTVIVSGGNIQKDFALDFLEKLTKKTDKKQILIIAADKGIDFLLEVKKTPDIVIGDFDSVSAAGQSFLKNPGKTEVIRLKPEKDDSDTQSAVVLAINRGAKEIVIIGATGSRLDHVMANMGLLVQAQKLGCKLSIVDANNWITLAFSGMELLKSEQYGKYVSFFPLGKDVENLTLQGFKYPLRNHLLTVSDSGLTVSNEIKEETARITYTKGNLLMIMSKD